MFTMFLQQFWRTVPMTIGCVKRIESNEIRSKDGILVELIFFSCRCCPGWAETDSNFLVTIQSSGQANKQPPTFCLTLNMGCNQRCQGSWVSPNGGCFCGKSMVVSAPPVLLLHPASSRYLSYFAVTLAFDASLFLLPG